MSTQMRHYMALAKIGSMTPAQAWAEGYRKGYQKSRGFVPRMVPAPKTIPSGSIYASDWYDDGFSTGLQRGEASKQVKQP